MNHLALRAALIWRDEVMQDVVIGKPGRVTLGGRCARQFPWLLAAAIVALDGLVVADRWTSWDSDTMYHVPIWAAASLLLGINLTVWFLVWSRWRESGPPTFLVPDLGLPSKFAVFRPGNRGYLLTLGERMRGTICIAGAQQDVAELVQRDASGGFSATAIGGRDWGVIELDESGHYKLFFQFVPVDEPQQMFTARVLGATGGVYVTLAGALTRLLWAHGSSPLDAVFGGSVIAAVIISGCWVAWLLIRQDSESQASLAFSVVLHGAFLVMTYQLYDGENPFVWPGPRALTGNYLVARLDREEPPEPKPVPTIGNSQQPEQPAPPTKEPPKNTATKGDEGRAGGKGDTERARDPNAKDVPPAVPKVQFFEDKNKKILDNIIDRNLMTSLSKFTGIKSDTLNKGSLGFGPGIGTGVGPGEGTGTRTGSKGRGSGGGGNVAADFVSGPGRIDTGGERPGGGNCKGEGCGSGPKAVHVGFAEASGDFGGLTAEEIDRVVKARTGVFRACYQKELNHTPGIGGKLVVHFKIGGDGVVQAGNTATASGSTLRNDAVEQCVKSNVNRLKFPAKGGIANVNYPFVFTQGG